MKSIFINIAVKMSVALGDFNLDQNMIEILNLNLSQINDINPNEIVSL